jgi:hypothetical protein
MAGASPILQLEATIDDAAEVPVVQFVLTNAGPEPIVLAEIGAVRADGVSFLVSEPCLAELAPDEAWPFSIPLAHVDGSQGPRTIGLRARLYDADSDETGFDVLYATAFSGNRRPPPDGLPQRLLIPMSGRPLDPDDVAALLEATSGRGTDARD